MVFRKKRDEGKDDEDSYDPFLDRDAFGFDDVFGDFKRIDQMMHELMKGAFSGKIKFEGQPFVYGFSLKTGPDGKPVFEEFGNVRPQGPASTKPVISEAREPLVDVMGKGEEIIVIAELPGVRKEDIDLEAAGKSLEIKVDTPDKKFYKRVELPCDVLEDATDATYNNGVLEVKLKRVGMAKPKGKKIQVK